VVGGWGWEGCFQPLWDTIQLSVRLSAEDSLRTTEWSLLKFLVLIKYFIFSCKTPFLVEGSSQNLC
jgi:hypothetical protein